MLLLVKIGKWKKEIFLSLDCYLNKWNSIYWNFFKKLDVILLIIYFIDDLYFEIVIFIWVIVFFYRNYISM